YLSSLGVQTVELGAGGYPGAGHLNVAKILSDDSEVSAIKALLAQYNMTISAISCHGNPVHPQKDIAEKFHNEFLNAVLVAEKLGVDTVITFSGCPGDSEGSKYPNWVTCSWPEDFGKVLQWQWDEVLIPYWKKTAEFCKAHNVTKIAFEMHPGFCVYNTTSLLKLREAVGDSIGANFDPSHLFWQGMNPTECIKELAGAIYHFHAKDTRIDHFNTAKKGVLDTGHYGNILDRSWVFRTVGYGSDETVWKDMMSALAATGYEGAVSIEHEDGLMSVKEGLEKAIAFLQKVMIFEDAAEMWWA
ncbi:MAG: xylose isomerase, partial [Clostridiales bacterium 43-6]